MEEDAKLGELFLVAVEDGFRQTELRDAVPQNAADLLAALKHCHLIAALCQQNADGDTGRTAADDGDSLAGLRLHFQMQMVKIGIRDIILDTGKMNRRALASQNAMPLALLVMVADQQIGRASCRERV